MGNCRCSPPLGMLFDALWDRRGVAWEFPDDCVATKLHVSSSLK